MDEVIVLYFPNTVEESFPRTGADAPLRLSANPQRNFSKAMDDRLAPNRSWHGDSWVQSLELCMSSHRDRPKVTFALSPKIRKKLPKRDIVRP